MTREEFQQMVTKEEFQEGLNGLRSEMKREIGEFKTDLKDYIDEKLADLHGDIVVLMRKEDYKVLHLIKLLKEKKILEDKEVKELIKMEPFPKMTL